MAGSFFFVLEAESITLSKERTRGWKTLQDTKRHRIVHEAMFRWPRVSCVFGSLYFFNSSLRFTLPVVVLIIGSCVVTRR